MRTILLVLLALPAAVHAQTPASPPSPAPATAPAPATKPAPQPFALPAPQFSADINRQAILNVMRKVADWQIGHPAKHPPTDWTQGAYYAGVMALAGVDGEGPYGKVMLEMGRGNGWKLGPRLYDANEHCVGQTYVDLYLVHKDPAMLEPMRRQFDAILAKPVEGTLEINQPRWFDKWTWCDALFMSPSTWARLASVTGEKKYLDFMNREWWKTTDYLYDKQEHLYFRDSRFFTAREPNGRKVFWCRGNGWVIAGLARVLQFMPADYPDRARYVQLYREMIDKLVEVQGPDGLWRTSLLDPQAYPTPDSSGSGFMAYAIAWGINQKMLEGPKYRDAAGKAWRGLVACVAADGRLGFVQPIGEAPRPTSFGSTDTYGVGAFLLAGSEMAKMAKE